MTAAAIVLAVMAAVGAALYYIRRSTRNDVALEQTERELELERARRAAQEKRDAEDRAARKQELQNAVKETARDRDAARAAQLLRVQLARLKNPKP